jgi:hypothetical protein
MAIALFKNLKYSIPLYSVLESILRTIEYPPDSARARRGLGLGLGLGDGGWWPFPVISEPTISTSSIFTEYRTSL